MARAALLGVGLTDVAEGQFVVEVRRADGSVLGAVVAYDRSLKDGSVIDAVTVPVTLKP